MKIFNLLVVKVLLLTAIFTLTSCSDASVSETDTNAGLKNNPRQLSDHSIIELDIYKSRTCSCCQKWISPTYHSCHTAESKGGYVFEGHVPAKYIKAYLNDVPEGVFG